MHPRNRRRTAGDRGRALGPVRVAGDGIDVAAIDDIARRRLAPGAAVRRFVIDPVGTKDRDTHLAQTRPGPPAPWQRPLQACTALGIGHAVARASCAA